MAAMMIRNANSNISNPGGNDDDDDDAHGLLCFFFVVVVVIIRIRVDAFIILGTVLY